MGGPHLSEAAVSSVIGTVLILGITVSVFAGVSMVVLQQFEAEDEVPRSDLGVVRGDAAYLLLHRGGDPIPLAGASLLVGVGPVGREVPLTDFAADTADGETWRLGENLCVSCLFPDQEITGVQFVTLDTLLLNEGTVPVARLVDGINLIVDTPEADPNSLRNGQSTVFRARITNVGHDATGANVELEVLVDGTPVGTDSVAPLASGTAAWLEVPWTATTGVHAVTFLADPADLIDEADEADNTVPLALTVVASVPDPGFAFEDVDLDGKFADATDLPIDRSEFDDGAYDAGANGLVLPPSWGPLSAPSINLAGARVEVHGDLTGQIGTVVVTSTGDVVVLGDISTLTNGNAITLAAQADLAAQNVRIQARGPVGVQGVNVDLTGTAIDLLVDAQSLTFTATGDLTLDSTGIQTRGTVSATAGPLLSARSMALDLLTASAPITFTATDIDLTDATSQSFGPVTLDAAGDMDLSGLVLLMQTSGHDLFVDAEGTLTAVDADLQLAGLVLFEGGSISASGLRLVAPGSIETFVVQTTTGALFLPGATLDTDGQLTVSGATSTDANGATLTTPDTNGKDVRVEALAGDLDVQGATLVAEDRIYLDVGSGYTVYVEGANFSDSNNKADVTPDGASVGTPASGGVE